MAKRGWTGESRRHGLARRGVKTARTQSRTVARGKKHEFADDLSFWNKDEIMEFEEEHGKIIEVKDREHGEYYIETEDGEYRVFEDYDKAEKTAIDEVEQTAEEMPKAFAEWLVEKHIYISNTDRRLMANEQADFVIEDMDEDDILDQSGYREDWDEIQEKIDELYEEYNELEEKKTDDKTPEEDYFYYDDKQSEIVIKKGELEKEQEKLIDEGRDKIISDIYDKWYEGLENPIQFLVNEQGMYTKEDLMKANFIGIDYREMSEEAVNVDGVGHFLATYDGNEYEIGDAVVYRVN